MNIKDAFDIIFRDFPEFTPLWKDELENGLMDGFDQSISQFSLFSDYVVELINGNQKPKLEKVFKLIEEFLSTGDTQVRTGVITCFLENILNLTPIKLDPDRYIPLLG